MTNKKCVSVDNVMLEEFWRLAWGWFGAALEDGLQITLGAGLEVVLEATLEHNEM